VLRDPPPHVGVASLGDSAIQIKVAPWVAVSDYGSATADLHRAVLELCRREGIAIPFPQREIRYLDAAPLRQSPVVNVA
jgi:small conductance mechanosensitive channel